MRRRPFIRQRTPIFVGCEGESERSYVTLLGRIADQAGLSVHLDPVLLRPGGGDPCALVELAVKRLKEKGRGRGTPYRARFIMLDDDRLGQSAERDARAHSLAAQAKLIFLWQSPCHEALLLRHLADCAALRPPTTPIAEAALRQRWPDYGKGMAAAQLARRLDVAAVRRAAAVEPTFAEFVSTIGLTAA